MTTATTRLLPALAPGAAVLVVMALVGGAHAASPAPCAPGLEPVFSCSIGKDTASVCASHDLSATTGTLQYRFGRTRPGPSVHPADGTDWRPLTQAGTWMFSGGGGAWIAFEAPPYRHVVYTAIGRGWGEKSGVVVERDGRRVAHRRCADLPQSALGAALFERAGLADDGDAFQLP